MQQGVSIHSFDRLNDFCRQRSYGCFLPNNSAQMGRAKPAKELLNKAVSPFLRTVTDHQWRTFLKQTDYVDSHILADFVTHLVPVMEENLELLSELEEHLGTLDKAAIERRLEWDYETFWQR